MNNIFVFRKNVMCFKDILSHDYTSGSNIYFASYHPYFTMCMFHNFVDE